MTSQVKLSQLGTGPAVIGSDLFYSSRDAGGGNFTSVKQPASALATFIGSAIPALVFNAQEHGWLPDGTDRSAQALALLTAVDAAGGGTIYFPASAGVYRADSQLLIPNNLIAPQAAQHNVRLSGAGGGANWYAEQHPETVNAAVLDLRYNSNHSPGGRLLTLGLGSLVVDHLQFMDGGAANNTPFIWTTNTVCNIKDNTFRGNGRVSPFVPISNGSPAVISWGAHGLTAGCAITFITTGTLPTGLSLNTVYYVISPGLTADTFRVSLTIGGSAINTSSPGAGLHNARFIGPDAIVCGGRGLAIGPTADSPFQGYGTVIQNNAFTACNGGVFGQGVSNSLQVLGNSFIQNFGLRAIEFDYVAALGQPITAVVVVGNIIEMPTCAWGIKLTGVLDSFFNNSFNDIVGGTYVSDYLLVEATHNNVIISQLSGGKVISIPVAADVTMLTQNTYVGANNVTNPHNDGIASTVLSRGAVVQGTWTPANFAAGALNIRDEFTPDRLLCLSASTSIAHIDSYSSSFGGTNIELNLQPRGGPTSISGPLQTIPKGIVLVNGVNLDVNLWAADATAKGSYLRISGPTGAFSVQGFSNQASGTSSGPGSILRLYNSTAFAMTIKNNAGNTATNGILTMTGADVVLAARTTTATLIYDDTDHRWILCGTS